MNKTDLINSLAESTGLSKAQATNAVNAIFDPSSGIIATTAVSGQKVTIPGFGTFTPKTRAARTGTNPATGERIQIPSRNTVTFTAGTTLKNTVNG